MALTQGQLENIQIDHALVYVNYETAGERLLAPTRGGGTFIVTKNIREIEYDGRKGKTKGAQNIDEMNAHVSLTLLNTAMDEIAQEMPWCTYSDGKITATTENFGLIPDSAYLENVAMIAKVTGGKFKVFYLYNAMNEADYELAAAPKAEGGVSLDIWAHWDAEDDTKKLYEIKDATSNAADTTPPTVTTVPDDTATGVVVSSNLTATFNEDIRSNDIRSENFTLIKASDGSIVDGTLSYTLATKTATFSPASDLDASTAYIWMIANVKDSAGNRMEKKIVNFETA